MNAENIVIPFLNRQRARSAGPDSRRSGSLFPANSAKGDVSGKSEIPFVQGGSARNPGGSERKGFREFASNALEFDIGQLLQLKSFVYLLIATGLFLFQTNNTLSIINLSLQNEKLRTELDMINSVLTAQELKVHELQSIHNIAGDAAMLGLAASSTPPVELVK